MSSWHTSQNWGRPESCCPHGLRPGLVSFPTETYPVNWDNSFTYMALSLSKALILWELQFPVVQLGTWMACAPSCSWIYLLVSLRTPQEFLHRSKSEYFHRALVIIWSEIFHKCICKYICIAYLPVYHHTCLNQSHTSCPDTMASLGLPWFICSTTPVR